MVSIVEHVVMCSILILNEILFFIIFYIRKNIIRRECIIMILINSVTRIMEVPLKERRKCDKVIKVYREGMILASIFLSHSRFRYFSLFSSSFLPFFPSLSLTFPFQIDDMHANEAEPLLSKQPRRRRRR